MSLISCLFVFHMSALRAVTRLPPLQPRPQGLLGFQYGGSGKDPGTQQITGPKSPTTRGWRFV